MSIAAITAGGASQIYSAQRDAAIQAATTRRAQQASGGRDSDGDNDGSKPGDVDSGGKLGLKINLTA